MVRKGSALGRKLMRDMWKNRMQLMAVVLLCALGTWVFSGLDAAWRMLELSADTYFENQNLADLWITMEKADGEALTRIRHIEGVFQAQSRASHELEVDLPHEPRLMATAYEEAIAVNEPLLYEGEALDAHDRRGCLLDREFALANGLSAGDNLKLKLGGETVDFIIRGLCLSPEYTALSKGALPDAKEYGFVLLNAEALPALPINSIVLTLKEGAQSSDVEEAISRLYPEALIINHTAHSATHGVQKDVDMFRNLSYLFPLLVYAVAAMIVLTTITRMLENQRVQMGTLKALGYRDGQLRRHYLSYAFYPAVIGSVAGMLVGRVTLPYILWSLEEAQFNLPYRIQAPISAAQGVMCVLGVALSCFICLRTYRKTAREQTAQLLRPRPPKAGKKLLLERAGWIWRSLGFNGKMIVRNLFRNKLRTGMMLIGVLCCTSLIITSLGLQDSVVYFVDKYFKGTVRYSIRADLTPDADETESYRKRLPAETVEGVMEKSVSIRTDTHARTTSLSVLEDHQQLMHLGENESWVPLPGNGVMLTQKLMDALDASVGDEVEIWLPGDEEPIRTTVEGVAYVTVGQSAMMSRSVWESHRKGGFIPTALLLKNPTEEGLRQIDDLDELDEIQHPDDQAQETLKILDSLSQIFMIMSIAALGLAFVVLYNMGQLNYMEREREYATLKVLGYHQKEIRHLICAENNLITLIGIALGIWPGWWLTGAVMRSCESDSMVFASTVNWDSYLIACVVTYVFSWLISRLLTTKVKKVDMVEALKSVE